MLFENSSLISMDISEINVLVIDDDSSFADMTGTFLKQENDLFSVTSCHSGEAGVSYFKDNVVDCVVCDYEMPSLDGLKVLEEIREDSDVPFILFTGRGSEEVASKAFSSGATDYLQKDGSSSTYELLANRIVKYVEKQELQDEQTRILEEKNRLLNRVQDGYISFDSDFQFLHLNSTGIRFVNEAVDTEYSYADLIGENLWEVVPKLVGTEFEKEYREALDSGEEREFEEYYEDTDKWFSVRAFPSSDGISIFIRDVSEEKQKEKEREEEIDVLLDLYDIASDSELSYEERLSKAVRLGRDFLDVSFGFVTQISDGKQEIMLAENTVENSQLYKGAICPVEESYCQNVLDSQDLISVTNAGVSDKIGQREYKKFQLESYISQRIFINDSVFGTLCFADFATRESDFSDIEKAIAELLAGWVGFEIERHLNRQELEQQNERLERFARFVSHDLRNPLSIAMGFCEIEQDRQGQDNRNLQKIEKSHVRIDEIISELLDFARSSNKVSDRSDVSL
jgi:DNA-binding response OmpR family regulator